MQKKTSFLPYFFSFIVLSAVVFAIFQIPFFKPVVSMVEGIFSPVQKFTYSAFSSLANIGQNKNEASLKNQNLNLVKKLTDQSKTLEDNKALRDQFRTQNPNPQNLIPADVVGAPGFIPGVSIPENLIIGRGEKDGVKIGDAVVYKDNLVGKVTKTTSYSSVVSLVSSSGLSSTAQTLQTKTPGVLKGEGGGNMILDNVLLSDKLNNGDLVLSKGDLNGKGEGFPPGLVVGKIASVSKNPSDLFQKAEVKSFLDFTRLNMVFVLVNP